MIWMLQQQNKKNTKPMFQLRSVACQFRSIFGEYLSVTPRQVSVGCNLLSNAPANTRIEYGTRGKIHEKTAGKLGGCVCVYVYVFE